MFLLVATAPCLRGCLVCARVYLFECVFVCTVPPFLQKKTAARRDGASCQTVEGEREKCGGRKERFNERKKKQAGPEMYLF